jgi:hypothetical protein
MWALAQVLPDILIAFCLSLIVDKRLVKNCLQRAGLYAGWELEFLLPITAAD